MREQARIIKRWRERPVTFIRDCFKAEPDVWQKEASEAFPNENRMALKSSKGSGKTAWLAWMMWNFISTRAHSRIAATAITGENLSDNLWTELAYWQNK